MTAAVMFVNGLPFFVTFSRDIKMLCIEVLPSWTVEQLCSTTRKITCVYQHGGHMVGTSLMDSKFEALIDAMDKVVVNTTTAREHVGGIK